MTVQWTDAPSQLACRSVFMAIYGRTGTGRTTLALSAPGPIALIHAAEKLEGIVQPFVQNGKDIKLYSYGTILPRGDEAKVKAHTKKVWDDFKDAMLDSMGWARTVVLDTHTEAWRLVRAARFGKLTQVKPFHYTAVNAEWAALMKQFRNQDKCNLIVSGRLRERYKNDKPTGIMEQSGMKDMDTFSDVIIRTRKKRLKGETTFSAEIEKGWWNAHSEGGRVGG